MAGLTNTTKNLMLDALGGSVNYFSLHTADPGATGTAEVSGAPYTREEASWASASGGTVATNANVAFDVPGSTTITHLGYWTALTSGTFLGSRALDTQQTFATAGTYTLSSGNITESLS